MDDLNSSVTLDPHYSSLDDTDSPPGDEPVVNLALAENIYTIHGCDVVFPYAAYESQEQMMEKLIKGVQSSENCLLESPTGTGKTAALLCGLLAWQSQFEKEEGERFWQYAVEQRKRAEEDSIISPLPSNKHEGEPTSKKFKSLHSSATGLDGQSVPIIYYATRTHSQIKGVVKQLGQTAYKNVPMAILASRKQTCINSDALDSNSIENTCQKFRNAYNSKSSDFREDASGSHDAEDANDSREANGCSPTKAPKNQSNANASTSSAAPSCGSSGVTSSVAPPCGSSGVMSSPRASASTQAVQAKQSKEPKRLCKYYHGALTESSFKKADCGTWDIEDLKKHGEECKTCPAQELRALQERAKILFCTYNHLLHKRIRKALKIELEGNVVVFDEAHNIEDTCRSIASFSAKPLSLKKIQDILVKFTESYKDQRPPGDKYKSLLNLESAFKKLQNWMIEQQKVDAPGFKSSTKVEVDKKQRLRKDVSDTFIDELKRIQFGPDQMKKLWEDYFVLEDRHYTIEPDQTDPPFRVDPDAMNDVANVLFVFNNFFKKDPSTNEFLYFDDFAKFLVKYRPPVPMIKSAAIGNSRPEQLPDEDIQLHLLCLNPAVVFQEMSSARTVVVTSGTLAPKDSFSTELGMKFHHELTAKHVIGRDRIFTSIINSNTAGDRKLKFDYASMGNPTTSTYADHQEQIFKIISRISMKFHYGILVFVPSTTFVTKLKSAWIRNENLKRLKSQKDVFFEHENRSPDDFNQMMSSYREKVKDPKGAIIFAVLRGKISEGVDFKDNEARAVITLGIPFPPLGSDDIKAKKDYNDQKKKKNPAYLSGGEWYKACAFRALNQAFGRCVRHIRDWGAVFIVDSRFSDYAGYKSQLSKWVQDSLNDSDRVTTGSLDEVMPDVQSFLQKLA